MVVLNADNHTVADEVQRAVIKLQALERQCLSGCSRTYDTPSSATGCCLTSGRG